MLLKQAPVMTDSPSPQERISYDPVGHRDTGKRVAAVAHRAERLHGGLLLGPGRRLVQWLALLM